MLRVERMVLREIRLPLREPFQISSGTVSERRICLLELFHPDGISEWAECVAEAQPNYSPETIDTAWLAIRKWIAPRVLGRTFADPGTPVVASLADLALVALVSGYNIVRKILRRATLLPPREPQSRPQLLACHTTFRSL